MLMHCERASDMPFDMTLSSLTFQAFTHDEHRSAHLRSVVIHHRRLKSTTMCCGRCHRPDRYVAASALSTAVALCIIVNSLACVLASQTTSQQVLYQSSRTQGQSGNVLRFSMLRHVAGRVVLDREATSCGIVIDPAVNPNPLFGRPWSRIAFPKAATVF